MDQNIHIMQNLKVGQKYCTLKIIEIYKESAMVFIKSTFLHIGIHCQYMKLYCIYVL